MPSRDRRDEHKGTTGPRRRSVVEQPQTNGAVSVGVGVRPGADRTRRLGERGEKPQGSSSPRKDRRRGPAERPEFARLDELQDETYPGSDPAVWTVFQ